MEFKVGQWVKFKEEKELQDRLINAPSGFAQNVKFDDKFIVTRVSDLSHVFVKTENGYEFGCRKGRLVPIIHILEGAEEL